MNGNFFKGVFLLTVCLSMAGNPSRRAVLDCRHENQVEKANIHHKVVSSNGSLWSASSEIEDGAIYMIRSVGMPNLYWDVKNGDFSNGTPIQLYECNYTASQKFIVKKQFDILGRVSYSFAPLYAYDHVLRYSFASNELPLKISVSAYDDNDLFTDKIVPEPYGLDRTKFYLKAYDQRNDTFSMISASKLEPEAIVTNKPKNAYGTSQLLWEFVKTDYMGLNVGNLVHIDGLNETRLVARVPHPGKYIIETKPINGISVDTKLKIIDDSTDARVGYNDDYGGTCFSRVEVDFTETTEHSVIVSGYSSSVHGDCYVLLRPSKTVYLCGTYDYDHQKCDRVSSLKKSVGYIRKMGYFPEIYANMAHQNTFDDDDWEESKKIDRDYYVFYGHGGNDGRYAVFYDGKEPDWTHYSELPNLQKAGVVLWMICNGGNSSNGESCMALESARKGAQFSIGFKREVYNISCDTFIPAFFKALSEGSSVKNAAKKASDAVVAENYIWWITFGRFHCDIGNPIIYEASGSKTKSSNSHEMALPGFDIHDVFVKDAGFLVSKNNRGLDCGKMASDVFKMVSDLRNRYDDVQLFVGSDEGEPKALAMCSSFEGARTTFFDLSIKSEITSKMFEKMVEETL